MSENEQQGGGFFEQLGQAAENAVGGGVAGEIGAIAEGIGSGPGAAIGAAAGDLFDSPRDPASALDALGEAAGGAMGAAGGAMGAAGGAVGNLIDDMFGGGSGYTGGGGQSGGGGSSDSWDPTTALPDPTPDVSIPPELESIIHPEVDPNDPYRIN